MTHRCAVTLLVTPPKQHAEIGNHRKVEPFILFQFNADLFSVIEVIRLLIV